MKIEYVKLKDLIEYDNNPRLNDCAVDAVANSIKEFGFKVPVVVDENKIIIAGNTRCKAARKLGMTEVPCIIVDDLTNEQVRAFRLADNKVAELAEWDMDALQIELDEIALDMGDSVTGGGLHGKDLSKADVSINIYAFLKAQELGKEVNLCCAIGQEEIDGQPYEKIVEIARSYIAAIGGFEKFAEWGLIR